MPVFEQGYRPYVGERSRGSRAFVIAWENVRPRMRWWAWALLLVLSFRPFLIHAVFIFVVTIGQTMFGGSSIRPASIAHTAFAQGGRFSPQLVLGFVTGDPLGLQWEVLDDGFYAGVILTAVLGAGLLASDRRTGALQIYFARPVSRLAYLLGKILAATAFVALTTVVPCLVLWMESVALAPSSTLTWKTWVAPLAIVGASSLYALWIVALVMALSSVMRRPAFVAISAIVIYLVLEGVGKILSHTLRDTGLGEGWHVISPSYAIGTMTAPLCGLDLPVWINAPLAFGVAVGLPIALLSLVWWRLRAVEVST